MMNDNKLFIIDEIINYSAFVLFFIIIWLFVVFFVFIIIIGTTAISMLLFLPTKLVGK